MCALLCDAVKGGDLVAVARLLAAGANPNALMTGRNETGETVHSTVLHVAAGHGRLEAARLLLDGGADPSLADSTAVTTPLMAAAVRGHLEVLRLLLERGAAVDTVRLVGEGGAAFHLACYSNHPECAEALVRAGCDVGIKTTDGQTGRDLAEAQGHTVVVERLAALEAERPRTVGSRYNSQG
jgi:ankyrin repeat protein